MLLWVLIALLTAAAIMAVLAPLARAPARGREHEARQVYLDQLKELDRDQAEGRLNPAEAQAARAEVARRLLAADEAVSKSAPDAGSLAARRGAALVALIGIPVVSLTLYLALGAPDLPGRPLAARLQAPAAGDDIGALLARVEDHLARAPEDGAGWDVIAPVYLRLGRAGEAATAYRNAIRLLGSSAARQSGLGEAVVATQGGIVTADARTAFEAATAAAPEAPGPRFFLGLAQEQEGNREAAAERWRALLAESAPDAPWRPAVEQALARAEGVPAPSAVAAAEAPAADQAAMIEGMVSGLAERLQSQPDDVEGWLRLIRSYVVLGRPDDASAAARDALAGVSQQENRERVEALIADLGVTPREAAAQ